MRFTTVVEQAGKTATGLPLPDDVVEALGGRRVPVVVTVNGYSYRTTPGSMGGRTLLPLAKEHREAAGVAGGEEVVVDVERDEAPRTVEVPADLAAALDAAGLRERFDGWSYSQRKEAARQLESAKAEATRRRRLEQLLDRLGG